MNVSKMSTEEYIEKVKEIRSYLDSCIGFYYWEQYYCTWFWTNISMPINLALTLATALIAAQASSTGSLLREHDYMILSFTTMILTIVNSYFKPQIKSIDSSTILTKWIELGYKLDDIIFDIQTPEEQYKSYKTLFTDMNKQAASQAGNRNFLTSWWHFALRKWYGSNSENWITSKPVEVKEVRNNKKNIEELTIEMAEIKKAVGPESLVSIIARQSESV
jgi:hypothetical protein